MLKLKTLPLSWANKATVLADLNSKLADAKAKQDEAIKEEATSKQAQADAQSILNQENPDPDVVAAAVSKLNEKLAELKAAKAELVVAATEDQKTKLKNDSDALKPAEY